MHLILALGREPETGVISVSSRGAWSIMWFLRQPGLLHRETWLQHHPIHPPTHKKAPNKSITKTRSGCRQACKSIFLISDQWWRTHSIVGRAIHGLIGLSSVRKQLRKPEKAKQASKQHPSTASAPVPTSTFWPCLSFCLDFHWWWRES